MDEKQDNDMSRNGPGETSGARVSCNRGYSNYFELDASEGIFLFLTAFSELIRKPCLELVILMISRLESSMSQK